RNDDRDERRRIWRVMRDPMAASDVIDLGVAVYSGAIQIFIERPQPRPCRRCFGGRRGLAAAMKEDVWDMAPMPGWDPLAQAESQIIVLRALEALPPAANLAQRRHSEHRIGRECARGNDAFRIWGGTKTRSEDAVSPVDPVGVHAEPIRLLMSESFRCDGEQCEIGQSIPGIEMECIFAGGFGKDPVEGIGTAWLARH